MYKNSYWLFEIPPLLNSELSLEETGRGKGWRRISPSYAVGRLSRFSGRSRSFVENHLRLQGFKPKPSNNTRSVTWIHLDGSQVRIDPAHRPRNPKPNPNPNIPGNIMSHERAHYHKIWSDGSNLLSLDDRGYVVDSISANAHIPAKRSQKLREFEFLFEEAPFSAQETIYEDEETASTAWKCRAEGIPCPEIHYDWLNPKGVCRLASCRKSKTYREPWGISPGTCTYRCPQGELCSGPMFGKSWAAFVPFTLCD